MTAPHPLCYLDIPSTDVGASKTFYEGVFGWTVRGEAPYGEFSFPAYGSDQVEGEMVLGGGFDTSRKPHAGEEGALLYLVCDDIGAKLADIGGAGGTEVKPKTEIEGGHGYYALFRDPSGNLMGIWSRS